MEGDSSGIDESYRALANPIRREIVCLLDEARGSMELSQLISALATLYGRPRHRVETAVVHTHLPKLEAVGFVDYDVRSDVIRAQESTFLTNHLDAELIDCKTCAGERVPIQKRQ